MSRVCRSSVWSNRAASAYTSPKAKLSKYSISSGSHCAKVETRLPNSWSWLLFAAALIAIDYTPAVRCAARYCSSVTGSSQVVASPSPEASRIA